MFFKNELRWELTKKYYCSTKHQTLILLLIKNVIALSFHLVIISGDVSKIAVFRKSDNSTKYTPKPEFFILPFNMVLMIA